MDSKKFLENCVRELNEISEGFQMPDSHRFADDVDPVLYNHSNERGTAANYQILPDRLNIYISIAREKAFEEAIDREVEDLINEINLEEIDSAHLNQMIRGRKVWNHSRIPDRRGDVLIKDSLFNLIEREDLPEIIDDDARQMMRNRATEEVKSAAFHELNHQREYNHFFDIDQRTREQISSSLKQFNKARQTFSDDIWERNKYRRQSQDLNIDLKSLGAVSVAKESDVFPEINQQAIMEYAKWERKELEKAKEYDDQIESLSERITEKVNEEIGTGLASRIERAKYDPVERARIGLEIETSSEASRIYRKLEGIIEERNSKVSEYIAKKNRVKELYDLTIQREREILEEEDQVVPELFDRLNDFPNHITEAFSNFLGGSVKYDFSNERERKALYDGIQNYEFSDKIEPILDDIFRRYDQMDGEQVERVGKIMNWEIEYLEENIN